MMRASRRDYLLLTLLPDFGSATLLPPAGMNGGGGGGAKHTN